MRAVPGLLLLLLATAAAMAATPPLTPPVAWPRTLAETGSQRIVIYQPQVETWQGDRLGGRAAIAVGPTQGAPSFGVAVFSARVLVDKPAGIAQLQDLTIEHVDLPTAPGQDAQVKTLLQSRMPKAGITTSLDQLTASFTVGQQVSSVASVPVQNPVPRIVFAVAPASLLLIDGAPVLHPLPGTAFQRTANARALLLKDAGGSWYALAAGHWYLSRSLEGDWAVLETPPAGLKSAQEAAAREQAFDPLPPPPNTPSGAPAPRLIASTMPAELVQTRGEPALSPVAATQLLEMRNADHAAFVDMQDNRSYVLVSGRWFAAADRAGPWTYVPSASLPADFAKIPPADPMANALVSVPGTPQAKEAVIASTIPQTATVQRNGPALQVTYAGAPAFAPITGTAVHYATNTATPVISVSASAFYALSNGVWFTATTAQGPWRVATAVPATIYSIPPSSPVYYVTYVHIYRVTPSTVVIGYTPGYLGVYVAPDGTVVYGTGYAYAPVIVGPAYYAYPATYGYGAAFAWGAATGFAFGYAAGYCASPYWGPYWHGSYVNYQYANVNHYNVYGTWGSASVTHASGWYGATAYSGTSVNAFNPYTGRSTTQQYGSFHNTATGTEGAGRRGTSYNSVTGATTASRAGVVGNPNTGNYAAGRQAAGYNPSTGTRGAHSTTVTGNTQTGQRTVNSRGVVANPNTNSAAAWHNGNVYAGHDGNVYRRQDGSWQKATTGGWAPVSQSNSQLGALNGQRQARSWGAQRAGGRFRR
ncbi:MAG TPA: hypothetical protein VHY76_13985 [Acetobacteraceae bacterium]|jgi:hypothetical protein|nr:hypothetical protein [Acetobacteraceae bacterium]